MRVVVAEDVMLTREGIARLLTDAGVEVAAEAGDAASLLGAVRVTQPDAAIVDIRMPPTHTDEGLVAAQQIRTEHPGVSVLILSQYVEPHYAMRLLEEHPERVGYLLKERVFDVANLIDALRRLADGETVVDPTIVARLFARKRRADPLGQLSGREREVLGLVAEGLSNRAIATRLFVTERTVEAHVNQIFLKLGLDADPGSHRRVLAVLAYLRSTPLPTVLLPGQAGAARARQVSSPAPRQRSGAERGRTPRSAREPGPRGIPGSACSRPVTGGLARTQHCGEGGADALTIGPAGIAEGDRLAAAPPAITSTCPPAHEAMILWIMIALMTRRLTQPARLSGIHLARFQPAVC